MAIDLFSSNLSFDEIKGFLETHQKLKHNVTIHRMRHQTRPLSKPPCVVADSYMTAVHCHPIGERWHNIAADTAIRIMTRMLSVSSAYRIKLLGEKIAKQVANRLIDQFDDSSTHYLTNISPEEIDGDFSWSPITNSTFDIAVVLYDAQYIGLICIEDED